MKLFMVVLGVVTTVLTGQSDPPKATHIYLGNIPCVGVLKIADGQVKELQMHKKSDNSVVDTLVRSERTILRVGVRDVPNDEQFIAVMFIEVSKINSPQEEWSHYQVYAIRPKVLEEIKKYFGEVTPTKKPA